LTISGYSQKLIKTDTINYISIGGLKLEFLILDSIDNTNVDLFSVPKYILGEEKLKKHLSFRIPPEILEDTSINLTGFETIVEATFVIDKIGNVKDIKILKGQYESTRKDILVILNKLQKFEPARYNNRPVDIRLTLKVKYKIV